ncbi:MAG: hypothetical protein OHK0017_12710 [Patescibacteria group bacterium]
MSPKILNLFNLKNLHKKSGFRLAVLVVMIFGLLLIPDTRVNAEVTVSGINPDNGSISGGTVVNISGSGFLSEKVKQISAGLQNTCALFEDGNVKCWGDNSTGQLGYGNTMGVGYTNTPADVGVVNVGGKVTQIAVGGAHTCALLDSGNVRCWGFNQYGQLGYGNTNRIGDNETPASIGNVDVGGQVTQVVVGGLHTCVLLSTGNVKCWGQGGNGSLGYGNNNNIGDNETPASIGNVDVGGQVTQLTAGESFTCALLSTQNVRCWGYAGLGQLGYGNTNAIGDNETPASIGDVNIGAPVASIGAGGSHTCVLLTNGNVKCWGYGSSGSLGYSNGNTIGDNETPASVGDVNLGGTVTKLSVGFAHNCVVFSDNPTKCWGYGLYGQLGYGNSNNIGDNETPASQSNLNTGLQITDFALGQYHTCGLTINYTVQCWGYNYYGQIGYGNSNTIGDNESISNLAIVPLYPGNLSVKFGSLSASYIDIESSSQIIAVAPATSAGTVSVSVTNPDGTATSFANAFTFTSSSCTPSAIPNSTDTTSVCLDITAGVMTLYAGDSNTNNDICTPANIEAGEIVDTTVFNGQNASVACSTAENSIALTSVVVGSQRQNSTAFINDIVFDDLRGLASTNYTVTATVSNFSDGSKSINLGSNPDSSSSDTDIDAPQNSNNGKVFAVLNPSNGEINILRNEAAINEGVANYQRGSSTTVISTTTPVTLLSTTEAVTPARINLSGVIFKLRIPAFAQAGNYKGVITQTVI